jgi:FtsP/CotA-like multicopper oxidase with cupredoxin domain
VYQISDVTDPANHMHFPSECPGPNIFCRTGDVITINVTNTLNLPHAFSIPGMVDTAPIAPGATVTMTFAAGAAGTYLYHDNLNAPVNRVMGLHGAFIVMPAATALGPAAPGPGLEATPALTPYDNPTPGIQELYNDFGRSAWYPGLRWAERDSVNAAHEFPAQPTRQHVWLCHQASPVLFEEVGLAAQEAPPREFNAAEFVRLFTADPFINTSNDPRTNAGVGLPKEDRFNRKPHFFTIAGQSGHFAHHNPTLAPSHRIGEPTLIRILNAGLWTHSLHMHANHFYITAVNNVPSENPIWVDVFNVHPMDHVDYTIPYMRPPDIPNARGIGRADAGVPLPGGAGSTYPPQQEFLRFMPGTGLNIRQSFADPAVLIDLHESQSPLCYPMHDHSEPTQVAQGANYNCGIISGFEVIGDRNTLGQMNYVMEEDFMMMLDQGGSTTATGEAAGPEILHIIHTL